MRGMELNQLDDKCFASENSHAIQVISLQLNNEQKPEGNIAAYMSQYLHQQVFLGCWSGNGWTFPVQQFKIEHVVRQKENVKKNLERLWKK